MLCSDHLEIHGYNYDLLVIGGGSGGLACAKEGRESMLTKWSNLSVHYMWQETNCRPSIWTTKNFASSAVIWQFYTENVKNTSTFGY